MSLKHIIVKQNYLLHFISVFHVCGHTLRSTDGYLILVYTEHLDAVGLISMW